MLSQQYTHLHASIRVWLDLYMLCTPSDFIAPHATQQTKRRYYVCAKSVHQLPRYTLNTQHSQRTHTEKERELPKHNPTVRTRFVLKHARIRLDEETLSFLYIVALDICYCLSKGTATAAAAATAAA